MFSERFTSRTHPKEAEASEYKDADPTTFSPLPLTGKPSYGEMPVEIGTRDTITVDGESYVELLDEAHPKKQQIIALLTKGIIPVADIVSHQNLPGKRFSKVLPPERIEAETTMDDAKAYAEFLWLVFADYDHRASESLTRNVRVEDGKTSLYDFELASLEITPNGLKNRESDYSEAVLKKILPLIESFSKRIEGEEGKAFVESVFKHADASTSDVFSARNAHIDDVLEILRGRVNRAELIVRGALRDRDVGES
jgi:hypothetical protein